MAPEFEKKVDNATRGIKALKRFWGEFKGLIYAILVGLLGFMYIIKNPDVIMKKVEQTFIHNEVIEATNKGYATSELRKADSTYIAQLEYKSRVTAGKLAKAIARIADLESQIATVIEIQDANQLHRKFNTTAISIACDALKEEMDKKENACGWTFYETNAGDNWNIFKDKYESSILYSVDLRTDCRAYYTPIFGSKIKAN